MIKHIILAATVIVFTSPAFAGDEHHKGSLGNGGGTSATSTSGFEAGGKGASWASGAFENRSYGAAAVGAGRQNSETGSFSKGFGQSTKNASWDGYATGAGAGFAFGGFGHH